MQVKLYGKNRFFFFPVIAQAVVEESEISEMCPAFGYFGNMHLLAVKVICYSEYTLLVSDK